MSDENAGTLEPEVIVPQTIETPEVEKEKPTELPDPEPVDNDEGLDDSGEQSEEFIDVERGGKTYKVPKALEGEFLMQADYTRKRQADAETAKGLESREAEINKLAEATEAELDARAQLKGINQNLEYYSKFTQADWDAAHDSDPMGTDKAWRAFEFLRHQKADLEATVSKTQNERTEKSAADLAKRVQETTAFAQKEIPGFKPELTDKLVKLAIDNGVPEATLKANWSPTFYKLLHLAHLGQETLTRQAAAPKVVAKPAAEIAPLQTVAAKSQTASRPSLAELAKAGRMEEYAAARKAGRTR